ncbi:TolC family protein [Lentibacter sp. XHP0401]|uniref:TolC family protein n=1 Tax=Lentibacter sp. XHP0401 TaxID=2984334 RepID=UPI0021E9A43D|nr:TolC family protein [Lentibacter sp. XHP0401]MCV2893297.1 TolC family protein [Lentibacter sp. XHP0401]
MGQNLLGLRASSALILITLMSGCMSGGGEVSRFKSGLLEPNIAEKREAEAANSIVISSLQARQSILPSGSAFDRVATPVLAANSRAAESELRSARLRAEAQSKNWLPTLGPSISLTSLSDAVASIVLDAVLYSGGRKKAEREFAKADVEVAAVNLAIDTNERVHTALMLYLRGQEARETATMLSGALKDMQHFEWIMTERVKGGVSDMSDLSVIRLKLAKMQADFSAESETAKAAVAELNAMSVKKLGDVEGVSALTVSRDAAQPLEVLLSEAEKGRAVANAKIDRAGYLPTVTASVDSSGGGVTGSVAPTNAIGIGMGANLEAIKATEEAAGRQVAQSQEEANRRLAKQEAETAALSRQLAEAAALTAGAKSNLDMFQNQYDAGQRQVMDVVGVYETYAAQAEAEIGLKYDLARARLDMAKELGLLADGGDI